MKLFPRITLLLLCSGLLFLLINQSMAFQGPKILVQTPSFDFGKIKEGKILEHSFQVLNKGDQPLKIERVRPG